MGVELYRAQGLGATVHRPDAVVHVELGLSGGDAGRFDFEGEVGAVVNADGSSDSTKADV